ncbi:MAG: PrsW family intramembrane metalloprotease [Dehalococcoidales bacterium]|nr:PrsW family intramembrane metalloprotease [Dehalococcoidales bacterium]
MRAKSFAPPWLLVLMVGVVLFVLTLGATMITGNTNYLPTLLLLGSFIVPVTFVTYFYEYIRHREISIPLLTTCLVAGGVLGSIFAGVVEQGTLSTLNVPGLFGVGLIEEIAKLIFPIAMYVGWRYRHEADGLLFGVAAGMGFAALETMGYGLTTLIDSNGDINLLTQVLLARGLISPAGHAAWTGFFCAVLWRQREKKGHMVIDLPVIGAFVVAILLHAVWNINASIIPVSSLGSLLLILANMVIVTVSLVLVLNRYRESRKAVIDGGLVTPE